MKAIFVIGITLLVAYLLDQEFNHGLLSRGFLSMAGQIRHSFNL